MEWGGESQLLREKCLILLLLLFTKLIFFSELVYKKVKITGDFGYFHFTTQKVQTGAGAT